MQKSEWLKKIKFEKVISNLAIFYIMFGFIFAVIFAIYYKWSVLTFMSPAFLNVMLLWPLNTPGFINDLLYYGWTGKPI